MIAMVEKRNLWFLISVIVIGIGLGAMVMRAFNQQPVLNFGIDFTGGSTMILTVSDATETLDRSDLDAFRQVLDANGVRHHQVQISDDRSFLVKTPQMDNALRAKVVDDVQAKVGALDLMEADTIGPSIGRELKQTSLWIIGLVSVVLLLYISWRFEFVFGIAALLALLHDGLVSLSFAALLNIEVNTAFVAAILTILGYSINDTIVIFDRVRENIKAESDDTIEDVANRSISQTIVRSINTSLTTIFVIGALYLFGGVTIKGFSLVLLIGILSGTYSSIFIASPLLVSFWRSADE